MIVESEVLKAQNCALSKFNLSMHSNEHAEMQSRAQSRACKSGASAAKPKKPRAKNVARKGPASSAVKKSKSKP